MAQSEAAEIIVADGGSVDNTLELAKQFVRVVESSKGRATQMNAGAEIASNEILVFLHADTKLPQDGFKAIKMALSDPATLAGCFRLGFDDDSFWMRVWSWDAWMHSHRFAFGDRAIFIRRAAFDALGGFPDQPIFEDLELVRQIRQQGQFAFLDEAVETSARRFRQYGALVQQVRNAFLWCGWILGLPPHRLKRFYSDKRDERDAHLSWKVDADPSLVRP